MNYTVSPARSLVTGRTAIGAVVCGSLNHGRYLVLILAYPAVVKD